MHSDEDLHNYAAEILAHVAAQSFEEEQLKGKYKRNTKTLSEEEEEKDKRIFQLFPRKLRTAVKNPPPSTSSSILFVEKTEMATNPPNPNSKPSPSPCKTEKTSRKRRAVQERKRSGSKAKKAKVAPFSWKDTATPECLTQMMNHMRGPKGYEITEGPRLIFGKKLTVTDVKPDQSRLLMPFKTLIRNDFLTPVESRIIAEKDGKKGVGAVLVDQQNDKWGLILTRWEMEKNSGKGTSNYALTCGWNDIVEGNGLKEGDDISIWSFRCHNVLCFALVLLPSPDMA